MRLKSLLFLSLFLTYVFAYDKDDIMKDYTSGNYKQVCLESASFYKNNGKNENLLTIIGDACVKSDFINPLGYIVKNLVSTPDFRQNASYFSTILLQKKLIYQFINDGIDLSNMRLPKTEHILSVVFENLATKNYIQIDEKIIIKQDNDKEIYLYKVFKDGNNWLILEEYENKKLLEKHWYI